MKVMEILSEQQIVRKIKDSEPFIAKIDSGAFLVGIKEYVPSICTAIHDGHRVHGDFAGKMLLSGEERRYEEDPFTGEIAKGLPISIQVLDSRYNYDLNREPDLCIYDEAWGKKVWSQELSDKEKQRIKEMHSLYYRVLDTLMEKLEQRYGGCILYDLHSYNYLRIEGEPPLFNLGTHFMDLERFGPVVDHLQQQLGDIHVHGVDTRAVRDEVFWGKGYQARFISENHPDSLCLPIEVKKVFMAEKSGELYPDVFNPLAAGMVAAIRENSSFFLSSLGEK